MANFDGVKFSDINLIVPNGWNQWRFIDSTTRDIHLSDGPFPNVYTPSDAFWVRSIITNCLIPWYNTIDPFHAFLISEVIAVVLWGLPLPFQSLMRYRSII